MSNWSNMTVKGRQEVVVRLRDDGLTATEIAKRLKTTRNAVLGLMFRMKQAGAVRAPTDPGDTSDAPSRVPPAKPSKKRRDQNRRACNRRAHKQPTRSKSSPTKPAPKAKPEGPVLLAEALPKRERFEPLAGTEPRQLADLEPCHCRWPVGEGKGQEQLFCAAPLAQPIAGQKESYCETHLMTSLSPDGRKILAANRRKARRNSSYNQTESEPA